MAPRKLLFSYDDDLSRFTQTVTNANTGEVIRQVPSPDQASFYRAFRDVMGEVFDIVA